MSSVFPKLYYNLPTKTYGGALRFLKGINPLLAKHQQKDKGISKPDADALKNTDDLYELIGRPLDVIPTIHVAGTNGKGSTSYKLAEGLKYSGLRTGLCTGPHISSFRERMQVNGDLVSEVDVVNLLETVINLCAKHEIPATFFEIAFIMTCLHFQSSKCDVVVLEVGMGGRFDASNVIASHLSVVTSIGMDHMNSLGGTLEGIAAHKAGIFKPHTAALVGPSCPMNVMMEEAKLKSAPLHTLYDHLQTSSMTGLLPPLLSHPLLHLPSSGNSGHSYGDKVSNSSNDSKRNSNSDSNSDSDPSATATASDIFDPDRLCGQLALASLTLLQHYPPSLIREQNASRHALFSSTVNTLDPALLDVVYNSRLPCRFEELILTKHLSSRQAVNSNNNNNDKAAVAATAIIHPIKVRVILDVAHNIPALSALMQKLKHKFNSKIRVVMGMSRGKGTHECLDVIKEYVAVDKIDFIQSDNKRAISPEELYEAVGKGKGNSTSTTSSSTMNIARGCLKRGRDADDTASAGVAVANNRYDTVRHTLHAVLDEMVSDSIASREGHLESMSGGVKNKDEDEEKVGTGTGLWSCRRVNTSATTATATATTTAAEQEEQEEEEVEVTGDSGVCSDVLVVCGTLYAMPHVRRALGILEPNDALDVDMTL